MTRKQDSRLLGLGIAVLVVVFVPTPIGAAIIGITAATWDVAVADPIDDDANLVTITAGTTYTDLTGATSAAVVDSGSLGGLLIYAGTAPASNLVALTDGPDGLNATTGSANIGDGINFFFGQNVDGESLFFVDFGGADTTVVRPIDGAGNLIGDFTLTTQSDGGVAGGFATLDATASGIVIAPIQGVVFNTSDFTGTGTLTGVEGIRLAGSTLDVMTVGIAVVPEPTSLALALIGGCGLMALARRSSRCRRRAN